ncbi:penicillin-binding transpeptidase domain-containing protein [Eubacterium sp.]
MFSLTNKIRGLICIFTSVILIFAFLVGRTFVINADEVKAKFSYQLEKKTYQYLTISTADNVCLYSNNDFSENSLIRLSTFHIVGDMNDGIGNSIIATHRSETIIKDKKNHQYFQDTDIKLTINSILQKNAYLTLVNQNFSPSGCIIILDYKTGEIKAMASTPALDVNNIENIPDGAYLNKALYSYVPGSVFKAVSVGAVLELHPEAKSFTYNCNSRNGHISCMYAHGEVSLEKALEKSCNCAISQLVSTYITPDELEDFVSKLGLTSKKQIADMICNQEGGINAKADLKWTVNGQGETLLSPISVARYYAILANNGKAAESHILFDTQVKTKQVISPQTSRFISSSLEGVVGNRLPCKAFGKTGTAQINDTESHSWFVCSLIDENAPAYTVLCFLERGGTSLNAKDVTIDFINNYIL